MYHTDIVIEIAKSYKRLTIYDGRKANLLLSAAREGHQKRPSQTPTPHTKVSIDITFPREVFLNYVNVLAVAFLHGTSLLLVSSQEKHDQDQDFHHEMAQGQKSIEPRGFRFVHFQI